MNTLSTRLRRGSLRRPFRWAVICLIVAFWGAYVGRNWGSLLAYRWQLDLSWLALSFLAGLAVWVTAAVIWQQTLIASGGSLRLREGVRLWATSMLARYLPGGVWHIAGRAYLAAEAGESGAIAFISTVLEQILSLLAALLLLLVSLPFWQADYGRFAPVLILVPSLAIGAHPAVLRRLGLLAIRLAGRRRGDRDAIGLASLPFSPPGYRTLLAFLPLYALPNILAALSLYFAAAAVGPVSPGQLPAFGGAYATGWILGFLAFFAPGGLGVRDGAVALLLTPIVGAPVAVAASLLNRVMLSLGEAAFVAACWGTQIRGQGSGVRGQRTGPRPPTRHY